MPSNNGYVKSSSDIHTATSATAPAATAAATAQAAQTALPLTAAVRVPAGQVGRILDFALTD